jgi:hypothetical protein
MATSQIVCDGCGLPADQEHIARRLKRLEKMTRFRPVHVQTLMLCAMVPAEAREYLYSATDQFRGEGEQIVRALGLAENRANAEETLAAFQRGGYLLTHVLECPVGDAAAGKEAMQRRLPSVLARIRRSYKPKRVVLVGAELEWLVTAVTSANLDAMVFLNSGKPFDWTAIAAALPALAPGSVSSGKDASSAQKGL